MRSSAQSARGVGKGGSSPGASACVPKAQAPPSLARVLTQAWSAPTGQYGGVPGQVIEADGLGGARGVEYSGTMPLRLPSSTKLHHPPDPRITGKAGLQASPVMLAEAVLVGVSSDSV